MRATDRSTFFGLIQDHDKHEEAFDAIVQKGNREDLQPENVTVSTLSLGELEEKRGRLHSALQTGPVAFSTSCHVMVAKTLVDGISFNESQPDQIICIRNSFVFPLSEMAWSLEDLAKRATTCYYLRVDSAPASEPIAFNLEDTNVIIDKMKEDLQNYMTMEEERPRAFDNLLRLNSGSTVTEDDPECLRTRRYLIKLLKKIAGEALVVGRTGIVRSWDQWSKKEVVGYSKMKVLRISDHLEI